MDEKCSIRVQFKIAVGFNQGRGYYTLFITKLADIMGLIFLSSGKSNPALLDAQFVRALHVRDDNNAHG